MKLSEYLKLNLPNGDDLVNVDDLSENFEILDNETSKIHTQIEDLIEDIPKVFHDVPQNAIKEDTVPADFEYGVTFCSQSLVGDFPTIGEYGVSYTLIGKHSNYAQIFITRFGDMWARRSTARTEWNGEWYNSKQEIDKHINSQIYKDEVHGMKFNDKGKLEVFNGTEWIELKGGGLPVNITKNIMAEEDDEEVRLYWEDPDDVIVEGKTVAKWQSTKIVRKQGSKPLNDKDGIIVGQSSIRNQYKNSPFIDRTGLVNEETYYYGIFPESEDEIITVSEKSIIEATPKKGFMFGLKIDENNSNPETAVTYIGENADFTPANGIKQSWGDWKPFVDEYLSEYVTLDLETKEETQKIDPYNWTKTINGKDAVLDGSKGDLMWKVPKLYWKFERKNTDLYIYLATMQVDEDYVCLAHTKGSKEMDYIYYSVMLGTEKSSKLRSIDGGTPTRSKTIGDFRTLCEANGDNVHMLPYYPWLLYQIIVLMLGKNRDTQTQFGNNQNDTQTNVAKNLSKGMIYGQSAKGSGVNLFIADPWGNQSFFIDGIKYDSSYNILVGTENFNNDANGYANVGKTKPLNGYGYIDEVYGTTKLGFVPTSTSGSDSTHYADYVDVSSGDFLHVGGNAGNVYSALPAGAFYWFSESATFKNSSLSARLFVYGL